LQVLSRATFQDKDRMYFIFSCLGVILFFLFFYSLSLGPLPIPFEKVLKGLFIPSDSLERRVIFETRLPRTLTGCLTGACLALSGMMLQYVTRNPMACPSLLGVNQGAGLGIVAILAVYPFCPIPIFLMSAVVGGVIAALLTYFIAAAIGVSPLRLILAGQAINALFYAITQAILIFLPTRSGVILINLNGSLSGSSWQLLKYISPILIFCAIASFFQIKKIHILSLGTEIAHSVGLNVKWIVILLLSLVVLLCSCSVGLVGPILFFPLIVNHFGKIIVGENPYYLMPFVIIFGAILMLFSDILIKLVYVDKEVAVGFLIAIVGAPILIMSSRMGRLLKNE
jgi:iron complex transport system permease protein